MVLKIYSFSEIPSADIQWLTHTFDDTGPWFILYWKKALGNPYKIAVQDIEKVTSSSLRVLPNLVRWYLEYPIILFVTPLMNFYGGGKRLFEV